MGEVEVRSEEEMPLLLADYEHAIIGVARQLTDSGVVRNVAVYSQSIILNDMIYEALNFIGAHNGDVKGSDYQAAYDAAIERFESLLSEWEGPGMPVFMLDFEEVQEDDRPLDDGQEESLEG